MAESKSVVAPPAAAPATTLRRPSFLETVDLARLGDEDGDEANDSDLEFLPVGEGDDEHDAYALERRDSELIPDDSDSDNGDYDEAEHSECPSASTASRYGVPASPEDAARLCPPGEGGLIYHATLVTDEWRHPKDCLPDGRIKPRRASLPVRASDFFASLVRTEDGRWLFSGVLNGWPGLTTLEVRSITCLARRSRWSVGKKIVRFWDADRKDTTPPSFPTGKRLQSVRATLRAPAWSARGWSADSPGCVWWFEAQRIWQQAAAPRLSHGEDMIRRLEADTAAGRFGDVTAVPTATRIHHFAHRYARPGRNGYETAKQKLTYHGAILLEWSHGLHCTIVELATLNGVGGRSGKANWFHDKNDALPALYRCMPPSMIMPWKGQFAEIRVHDVAARTLDEFKAYVESYTGPELRFLDVNYIMSADVRLFHRRQTDVQRYLLNYMGRDRRYTEEFRNCQTFAADFFGFMAGKAGIEPFHRINRVAYRNRSHNFLYSPELYGPPHAYDV